MITRWDGPPAPTPRSRTLGESLERAAAGDKGLRFLDVRERETRRSYRELQDAARRVAGALVGLGMRRGDRVALVLPTSPGLVEAFFGCVLAGAVPVPLYPPVRLGRLDEYHGRTARMLRVSGARLVLCDPAVRRLLGQAVRGGGPDLGCRTLESLPAAGRGEARLAAAPDDLAFVQFSSGSTVDPKPVALSHRNVLANVAAIDALIGPEPVGVSWLPLYHDMGLVGCLLTAVEHPGELTLLPPEVFLARPALWLRAVSRSRATISPAPNFAFGLAARRIRDEELEGVDLSCWRLALNGAEPVSPEVLRRFSDRFARWGFSPAALKPVYGLSEATLAVTFSDPDGPFAVRGFDAGALAAEGQARPGDRELASVGRPLPGLSLEIRAADGRPLPEGRVGRIFVRGASVMTGYLGQPAATEASLQGGWLDTGDLGFVHEGALFVSGRAKDVLILRGANHPPQLFEEALDDLAPLRPGCAVAVPVAGEDGEQLAILAEVSREAAPETPEGAPWARALEDRVRTRLLERTGIRPDRVLLLSPGTLPRTSSGKLRRAEARRRLEAGTLTPPRPVTVLRLAGELVRSTLAFARVPSRATRGERP